MLHSLVVELGGWQMVHAFACRVCTITTDMGVESLLSTTPTSVLISSFLPRVYSGDDKVWLTQQNAEQQEKSDFADGKRFTGQSAELDAEEDGVADADADPLQEASEGDEGIARSVYLNMLFPWALWVPGVMHVLHSATGELLKSLTLFECWFQPLLRAMVHFLGAPWMLERFRNTCLSGDAGKRFEWLFDKPIDVSVAEWRWGSVLKAFKVIKERQLPLRLFFDSTKMLFQSTTGEAMELSRPHPEGAVDQVYTLEKILRDPMFWAYLHMMMQGSRLISDLDMYFKSCPCHP